MLACSVIFASVSAPMNDIAIATTAEWPSAAGRFRSIAGLESSAARR
jgi:hypothetical protein